MRSAPKLPDTNPTSGHRQYADAAISLKIVEQAAHGASAEALRFASSTRASG
jgi:hypothetical protein